MQKSRVTSRDPLERNYHVFYQVLRGGASELLTSLALTRESVKYDFLSNGDGVEAKNFKDEDNYVEMMEAFELMGFPTEESEGLLKIVAAVLHLGNIHFDSLDEGEASTVSSGDPEQFALTHASRLLGVSIPADLGTALCIRTITTGPRLVENAIFIIPSTLIVSLLFL